MLSQGYNKLIEIIKSKKYYKLLGLDIGTKRIGVAIFNSIATVVTPIRTIVRTKMESDVTDIKNFILSNSIDGIIAGIPLQLNGAPSASSQTVLSLIEELNKEITIPIITHDERFTTALANTILKQIELPRIKRNKIDNEIAASLILEGFLIKLKDIMAKS